MYSQLSQSAYGAVPMPYVTAGLGRSNNYIEEFTMGRLGLSRSWSPIIPNSQLAIFSGNPASSKYFYCDLVGASRYLSCLLTPSSMLSLYVW